MTPKNLWGRLQRLLHVCRYRKLLWYWPVFGGMFLFVERIWTNRPYVAVHCALDDAIPFCSYFLIPYLFWFVYLVGTVAYTFFHDEESFRKLMQFIIITYTAAIVIYLLFPTEQNLRPEAFGHADALSAFIARFYRFDTNTNVCPSIHVIGSLACLFAAWHSPRLSGPGWRAAYLAAAILICVSTLFLKQHSLLDLLAALPICLFGYLLVYRIGVHSSAKQKTPPSMGEV